MLVLPEVQELLQRLVLLQQELHCNQLSNLCCNRLSKERSMGLLSYSCCS